MTKLYCDRCGERIYDTKDRQRLILESREGDEPPMLVWDLCKMCEKEFARVITQDFRKAYNEHHSKS